MPKRATLNPELFDIRAPDFFRHSSFAIRHSAAYAKRKAHRASRSRLRINSSDGLPYWALITMPNAKANGAMKPEANTVCSAWFSFLSRLNTRGASIARDRDKNLKSLGRKILCRPFLCLPPPLYDELARARKYPADNGCGYRHYNSQRNRPMPISVKLVVVLQTQNRP